MPTSSPRDATGLESEPLFLRFRIPGATIPGKSTPVPDLLARSYPQSFQMNMREKITRTKTRGGWIEEHWPPEVDTVAMQGATGAFFLTAGLGYGQLQTTRVPETLRAAIAGMETPPKKGEKVSDEPGLGLATGNQVILRRLSTTSVNFEALIHLYKNNGVTLWEKHSREGRGGQVAEVKDIEMYYMKSIYLGYFTDFTHTHSDGSPNQFTYNFTFKVLDAFIGG